MRLRIHVAISALMVTPVATALPDAAWLESARQNWNIPGVAVGLVQRGQAPQALAAGMCNLERGKACSARSQFPIASTTKFLTGLLSAALVVENQLPFNEPISDGWPELRLSDERWSELTLKDLLSQRSGLGSVDWPYFWMPELTRADYLARLAHVPMAAPLRASWSYANANFVLAGTYLERRTGHSWRALLRERLLKPLHLKHATFGDTEDGTRGYRPDGKGFVAYSRPMSPAIDPAGGLVLSAADFGQVLQMILDNGRFRDGEVLPSRAVALASRVHVPWGHDRRFFTGPGGYGLGIFVARYRGEEVLYHLGGALGFSSYLAILPERGLAAAVLCNRIGSEFPQALALDALDFMLGRAQPAGTRWLDTLVEQTSPPFPADDAAAPPTRVLADYVGRYRHPAWGEFAVVAAGDGLRLQFGEVVRSLRHHRYDSFAVVTEPGYEILRLRFEANFGGDIDAFMMDDGVNPMPMRFSRAGED